MLPLYNCSIVLTGRRIVAKTIATEVDYIRILTQFATCFIPSILPSIAPLALVSWAFARVGVHRLFLFVFHTSMFFHSLFFTCLWISFVFLLYDWCICTHQSTLHLLTFLGEFQGLGLALTSDAVVQEAEQGCAWSRNLASNFYPGRGLTLGLCNLMAAKVTTRLQRTPLDILISRLRNVESVWVW